MSRTTHAKFCNIINSPYSSKKYPDILTSTANVVDDGRHQGKKRIKRNTGDDVTHSFPYIFFHSHTAIIPNAGMIRNLIMKIRAM